MTKRVRIGLRVSTKKQEDKTSLHSQERECLQWVKEKGYEVESVGREIYSGIELFDRPVLSKDRTDFAKNLFDVYLYHTTERLSRDPIHLAIVALECTKNGIDLAFVKDEYENTDEGALLRYIKGYAGKVEHGRIRERNIRGKYQTAISGKLHKQGVALYGYTVNGETRKREIKPEEAEVVRRIFDLTVEGNGMRTIARLLNSEGVPSPSVNKIQRDRPGRWSKSSLTRIIRNEAYKGETFSWKYHGVYKNNRQIKMVTRDRSEWIRLPDDTTPAIVTLEVWALANQGIDRNRGETTRNEGRPYLLRGMIFCGVCQKRMYSDFTGNNRVYRCSSRYDVRCGGATIYAKFIEPAVWEKACRIVKEPMELKTIHAARSSKTRTSAAATHARLSADLTKAERAIDRLLRIFKSTDDDVLATRLEDEIKETERKRQELLSKVKDAEIKLNTEARSQASYTMFEAFCESYREGLDDKTFEQKRQLLEILSTTVSGNGKKVEIFFSVPEVLP